TYQRRTVLDRASDEVQVRIEDRWQLVPRAASGRGVGSVVAHHVLAGDILEHTAGHLRLRALSGAVAELRWDPALGSGDLERREIDDPLLRESWGEVVHRLRLHPPTD